MFVCQLCGLLQIRHKNHKSGALVKLTVECNLGVDQVDQLDRNVQAEARTVGFTGPKVFRAEKFVKNPFLVALANTNSGVTNGEADTFGVGLGFDRDATFFSVFYSIGNEILQDFADIQFA